MSYIKRLLNLLEYSLRKQKYLVQCTHFFLKIKGLIGFFKCMDLSLFPALLSRIDYFTHLSFQMPTGKYNNHVSALK